MKSQLELDYTKAGEERDAGIEQAVSHANEVDPGWSDMAFQMLKDWLKGWPAGFKFLMEDFRVSASAHGLPDPPTARAFGSIAVKARKAGLIISNGQQPTRSASAHRCYANQWQKV